MLITESKYLEAVAKVMKDDESVKRLFSKSSNAKRIFTDFSFALSIEVIGKNLSEDEFDEAIADVRKEISPDDPSAHSIALIMAITIFALKIEEALEFKEDGKAAEKLMEDYKSKLETLIKDEK